MEEKCDEQLLLGDLGKIGCKMSQLATESPKNQLQILTQLAGAGEGGLTVLRDFLLAKQPTPVNLRSVAQAVSIPQFWLDLSEVERRFYFREFIQQIQIIRQNQEWYLQIIFIF